MPVSSQIAAQRQARYDRRMSEAAAKVPKGDYCYSKVRLEAGANGMPVLKTVSCPYFKGRPDQPEQRWGYCRLLKRGDFTQGVDDKGRPRWTLHLWDGNKECGVNSGDDNQSEAEN